MTITALNDLYILAAYVYNYYLSELCHERVWISAGPEFGNCEGKVAIVRQALYGLKSSGAAFWEFLADENNNLRRKDRSYLPIQ